MKDDAVTLREHGPPNAPIIVYLPGMHGDGTLIGGFRKELLPAIRLVEVTYPATTTWTLAQYAAETVRALREIGVESGWLLGESFGSQVLWAILAEGKFRAHGLILAGGFVRHPMTWGVRIAGHFSALIPISWLQFILRGFERYAARRHATTPELRSDLAEFVHRRSQRQDRLAMTHRYRLIAGNDFRPIARRTRLPLFGLCGAFDPIVPWLPVRRWLRRQCPGFRDWKVIPGADHNVLGSAARASASTIREWVKREGLNVTSATAPELAVSGS